MQEKFRVYTTTPCTKCDATKRRFKKHGLEFEALRGEDHPDVVEEAKASGATTFPIVIAPDGSWWTDYRQDKIDTWAKALSI